MTDLPLEHFSASCIQMTSGKCVKTNIHNVCSQIKEAAQNGAHYIQTPEMTNILVQSRDELFSKISYQHEDWGLKTLCALAKDLRVWLHIGSMALKISDTKAANRGFIIDPNGAIFSYYDKIHMFDVTLDNGESYRESNSYEKGEKAIIAHTDIGIFGMAICYDLRFAHLFRMLCQSGAQILTCPAAFTHTTGKAHWHALLRSRAIETGSWMIASAQAGSHEDGRRTYGHAMIINPWGEIIAETKSEKPEIIYAEIDLNAVSKARGRIPALKLDANFSLEQKR